MYTGCDKIKSYFEIAVNRKKHKKTIKYKEYEDQ